MAVRLGLRQAEMDRGQAEGRTEILKIGDVFLLAKTLKPHWELDVLVGELGLKDRANNGPFEVHWDNDPMNPRSLGVR
jgi:hypothetical protein